VAGGRAMRIRELICLTWVLVLRHWYNREHEHMAVSAKVGY
jgi:hypothetical protein